MKASTAVTGLFPRLSVMGWFVTAVICWGGLLISLPGYAQFFIGEPLRLNFSTPQMIFAFTSGFASLLCAFTSLGLATFLFLRKPGDRAALFVSFYLLTYGFVMAGPLELGEYVLFKVMSFEPYRIQAIVFIPLTIMLLLIFPNGTISPARFRWLIPFILMLAIIPAFLPSNEIVTYATWDSQLLYSLTLLLFLLAMGAQVYRYIRKSTPVERQQTKIVIYGLGIQFLLLTISSAYFPQVLEASKSLSTPPSFLTQLFWFVSLTLLPISLTLAVVRSHLWDIDVVIRRTLIYGFLSAALFLLYFGSVILMQYAFRLVAGHESSFAIVISTLVIAGLFTPLRRAIQAVIDRRFFRSKYNSEQALARFQHSMRDRVDLNQVEKELTSIVQVTVQPEWIMVWMRKPVNEPASAEKT